MSDEPTYCVVCGAADWQCDHDLDAEGEYCELCGVKHRERGETCPWDGPGEDARETFLKRLRAMGADTVFRLPPHVETTIEGPEPGKAEVDHE